jgi:Putative Ig domain
MDRGPPSGKENTMATSRDVFSSIYARLAAVGVLVLIGALLAASAAQAAVSISRAELSGTQLRIEGQASPNRTITVDGAAMGTSDGSGRFRIERSGFAAPADCTVDVNDGSATAASARLSGCTVSSTSPPPTSTPPPSSCTITPTTFPDGNVGTLNTWYFVTTGCRTSEKPVQFSVVSGQIPPGLTLFTQGVGSGGITGRPTTEGLFAFTIQVRDQTGARDTESFSIRINAPRPVVITNQSDQLTSGQVGQFYCCGNLFADGGVPGYTWTLRSGQLPPGLQLTASPGRITGTPTTRGTFTFVVRATDTRGAFAERTFTITVT